MSDSIALSLLQATYGTSGSLGSPASDPVAALTQAQSTQTQQIALEAKQPSVARTISQFTQAVASAEDPATLSQNPTVLNVLLTVNGLGDQTSYTALAQKALLSDPSDPNSLANQLNSTNSNWLSAASTYQFATKGLTVLQNPQVLSTITQGYAEVLWRQSLDATTPGLSNALTFIANASSATTADDILGDSTLRTVVTTALGIPAEIAYQDLGAQEDAITSHLDISMLQDPKVVLNLAQEYLLQVQSSDSGSSAPSLDQLAIAGMGLVA